MRIALTKSTLRIPPTYFAVSHGEKLAAEHELGFFTMVAAVEGTGIGFPIHEIVPRRIGAFRKRELLIPLFLGAMSRAIDRFNADVIHQHFAMWCLPAVRASRRGPTPLITTLHGADVMVALRAPRTLMERWHCWNFRLAMERSSKVLAVSKYLADKALEAGADPAKLKVHYQGIDTDYFVPPLAADQPNDQAMILFVGSLNEQKGIRDLVQASEQIESRYPHQLVIVGEGPLAGEIAGYAEQNKHLSFLGKLPREDVRVLMQSARMLVAPGKEHEGRREAAGLVLLEAQACGTPVIASRSGGMPEMLAKDETGLLTEEGDIEQIAAALVHFLSLPDREYRMLRERCREFVVRHRSLDVSCSELEAHYEEVVARN